jgi:hypothetical protein
MRVNKLLYGKENIVCVDTGYPGVEKSEELRATSGYLSFQREAVLTKNMETVAVFTERTATPRGLTRKFAKRQFGYEKVCYATSGKGGLPAESHYLRRKKFIV